MPKESNKKEKIYGGMGIDRLDLSVRAYNCLMRYGCQDLKSFMMLTEIDFPKIRNLGFRCWQEILNKQLDLINNYEIVNTVSENISNKFEIYELKLSFGANAALRRNNIGTILEFAKLTEIEINNFEQCTKLVKQEIIEKQKKLINENRAMQLALLKEKIERIDVKNYKIFINDVFNKETVNELDKLGITKLGDLKKFNKLANEQGKFNFLYMINRVEKFQRACKDLIYNNLLNIIKKPKKYGTVNEDWVRDLDIFKRRALGQTLQDAGAVNGVTRERVRQLEKQIIAKFQDAYYFGEFVIYLKSIFKNGCYALSKELNDVLYDLSEVFVYILKEGVFSNLFYFKDYDLFIIGEEWISKYKEILTGLPEIINTDKLMNYINNIKRDLKDSGFIVDKNDILTMFKSDYYDNGGTYSRARTTSTEKYEYILEKFYPKGISIYDEIQINQFIQYCKELFNNDELPSNLKSITNRLSAICLLIDRGTYGLKKDYIKSKQVMESVYEYIKDSGREVFAVKGLFAKFEKSLRSFGIKNKYYLYGLLKEYYRDEFYFRKEYVCKNKAIGNMREDVLRFISSKDKPISKTEIFREFPGLSGVTLQTYLTEKGILNYFGNYIHINNLHLTFEEINAIRDLLNDLVSDSKIHHTNELFTILSIKYNSIVEKCMIKYQYVLFSIVEDLFNDEYEFKRPYIARKGIEIPDEYERIKNFVSLYDEVSINEIKNFAANEGISINSIIKMVESLNEEFIFKDENNIIRIDKLFPDECDAIKAMDILEKMVSNNPILSAESVKSFIMFPEGYNWNQWILFSLINKYSDKVIAITNSIQFTYASGKVFAKVIFIDRRLKICSYNELLDYLQGNGLHGADLHRYLTENRLD